MPSSVTEVVEGIHRLDDGIVNCYLLEDGGRLTLVDAGFPRGWSLLTSALDGLGRSVTDIEAVLITHSHVDHIGFAERVRRESGATVYVHAADAPTTRRPKTVGASERSIYTYVGHGATRRLLLHATLSGAALAKGVKELREIADGEVLADVPGRPRVVHTPGHTDGHCSFHLPDRGVVFAGDAIVTRNPYTGETGPRTVSAAATKDVAQALASLDRFDALNGELLLGGHGKPWRGTPAEAARLARTAGAS